jgi:diphthamide biosynthesis enzyme Dph1/Dph2-like protein
MLQLDLTGAIEKLKKLRAKKVFLQIPEGLKTNVDGLVEELESKGFEIVTGLDPCFGACDLKESEAKKMGCDAILHLGHNKFVEKTKIPVIYAPLKYYLGENFGTIVNELKNYEKKQDKGGWVDHYNPVFGLSSEDKALA